MVRYRSMDQKSLTILADRIRDGEITQCRMTIMELEDYISYPLENVDLLEMIMFERYPNLIHVFNTGAERIDEDTMKLFIANVLDLTLEERTKKYAMFGRNKIHAGPPPNFVKNVDWPKTSTTTVIGTRVNGAVNGRQQEQQQMHKPQSGQQVSFQEEQHQQQQSQQQQNLQNQQVKLPQSPHFKQQLQSRHQQQQHSRKNVTNFTLNHTALMTAKSFAQINLNITPVAGEPRLEVKRSMWDTVIDSGV